MTIDLRGKSIGAVLETVEQLVREYLALNRQTLKVSLLRRGATEAELADELARQDAQVTDWLGTAFPALLIEIAELYNTPSLSKGAA